AELRPDAVPPLERGGVAVTVDGTPGISLPAMERAMSQIEERVARSPVRAQIDEPRMFARIGEQREGAGGVPPRGPGHGELVLSLIPKAGFVGRVRAFFTGARVRSLSDEEVALRLRQALAQNPPPRPRRGAGSAP